MPNYVAHFRDGSQSPVEIRGSNSHRFLIGVATRGDGYKRVLFFGMGSGLLHEDRWVDRITVEHADACRAYRAPQLVHARPAESVVA